MISESFCKTGFILVAVSLISSLISAQYIELGACPRNVNVVPDFNIEKYLGIWYMYAKYPAVFESDEKCVKAMYTQLSDGKIGVKNTVIIMTTGKIVDIVGYAMLIENAKMKVTFQVSQQLNATSNYWVLYSNYTSYSVAYLCQSLNNLQHLTFAWILTREREPSADIVDQAKQVLTQNGVSLKPLRQVVQTDCN